MVPIYIDFWNWRFRYDVPSYTGSPTPPANSPVRLKLDRIKAGDQSTPMERRRRPRQ